MDLKFLSNLSTPQLTRLRWYADNYPKPVSIDKILQDEIVIELWKKQPYYDDFRKIFPPYKIYRQACQKFSMAPRPPYRAGIPPGIAKEILTYFPPHSYLDIYETLYKLSYFNDLWKMRVCEVSYGLVKHNCSYSFRTILRSLSFLRSKWFVRLIWRGRPYPESPRYLHSCYELPFNFQHVTSWRIHHGRKRK